MFNYKKKFNKLSNQFNQRKEYFQFTINRWRTSGWHKAATRAHGTLQELEILEKNLHHRFTVGDSVAGHEVRRFKKLFMELHEGVKPLWRQWAEALLFAGSLAFVIRSLVFGLYHVPTGSAETTILVGDRIWGNKMAYHVGPFKTGSVKRGDLVIVDNPEFPFDTSSSVQYYWQKYVGVPLLGLKGGPDNWVKRVIGLPGDTIQGREEHGKAVVYVNGKKLEEPYINSYPLIGLARKIGLIDTKKFPVPLPSFLVAQRSYPEFFTFDPEKPINQQPFYNFELDEVLRDPSTGEPLPLRAPYVAEPQDIFGPYKIPAGKYWVMGDSRKNSRDSRSWIFLNEDLIHGRASVILFSIDSKQPFWLFDVIKHPITFWTKIVRWNRCFNFFKNPWGSKDPIADNVEKIAAKD